MFFFLNINTVSRKIWEDWFYINVKELFTWLPRWLSGNESTCQSGFDPWVRKIPWRGKWQPSPVFSPGKSHGQRRLAVSSPWGCKESDMTEHTHTDSCLSHLASDFYRWTFVHLKKKHGSYSLLEKERKIILKYKYEAIFQFQTSICIYITPTTIPSHQCK